MSLVIWWQRHRWTLLFVALALGLGTAIGTVSDTIVGLQAPKGSRPEFYIELYLVAVSSLLLVALLLSRTSAGLPLLLAVLAFLPSRSGMQWQGSIVITAADVITLVGFLVLIVRSKIVHRERLRPLVIRTPLWFWVLVGLLGLIVAVARNIAWVNWVTEIKGFYLGILIAVLCVNVVRTQLALWLIMLVAVLSALPNVVLQLHSLTSTAGNAVATLGNGTVVTRTSGGTGAINQFACYLMVVFFLSLGLAMASRRWPARLLFYGCSAYLLVGIGLTYTRGAWIGTFVGLVVLGIAGGWRVLAGVVTGGTVGYFLIPQWIWTRLNFQDNSTNERVAYLNTALAAIRANPIFGGGWGSNYVLVGSYAKPSDCVLCLPFWHNDYLIVATQVGLPGLAVFVWIWGALAVVALRARARAPRGPLRTYLLALLAGVAAMATQAFTEMLVWNFQDGPLLWLVVGLICAIINMLDEEAAGVMPRPVPLRPVLARRSA